MYTYIHMYICKDISISISIYPEKQNCASSADGLGGWLVETVLVIVWVGGCLVGRLSCCLVVRFLFRVWGCLFT